jgi:arylsulfatase A-like enzyme
MIQQRLQTVKMLALTVAMCLVFGASREIRSQERMPNVVVFLSDDQGWGDFSFQGNTNLKTPAIDSLAQQGALVERYYVCPVCAPTRAEFLTGRYHPRGSAMGVTEGLERLDLDEVTIADLLSKRGYATGVFGKWHNGSQYPYHPNGRGFQEFYGFLSGHWGEYFDPLLDHNGIPERGKGFVTDDFTSHAIEFIRGNRAKPFFCYIAYNTPHSPMQVPDEYFTTVKDREIKMLHQGRPKEKEDLAMTRAAIAMIENMDSNVGRVLEELKKLEIEKDTIVVYFNDNGPNSFRWNGGLKGRKGSVDEGGVRSPLLIQWPQKIAAGLRIKQLSGAVDLLPTLCDLTSTEIPHREKLDGISLAPQLQGESTDTVSRQLFTQWAGKVALREDDYLLDEQGELFDLIKDATQQKAISGLEPERTERMRAAVKNWKMEVIGSADTQRPFLVGHRQRIRTELPAQDGKAKGGTVKRSAPAPNCSYFTNWKSESDRIAWDIEVLESGKYEIFIEYAAPTESVGTKVRCEIGAKVLESELLREFVSEERGAEKDRFPRNGESLMKDFGRQSLGSAELVSGRCNLTLSLRQIKSELGVELKSVELIRKSNE